jgi:hypothetical protein
MTALQALIRELEEDRALDAPDRLRDRIDALDRIEACLCHADGIASVALHERADALCARLEAVNAKFYRAMRSEIQQGATPRWLLQQVTACSQDNSVADEGYDYRDVVLAGVLEFEQPTVEIAELAHEMVFYQPTPARHIFDLIGRAALTERDVFVDLGSGLGHVPLLVSICTNARSIGIECEAAYIECARQCARALNRSNATFTHRDAREADFSGGTLFYLYTPFSGTILRSVLDSLRREAADREIRICTYGPCTLAVAAEPWLEIAGPFDTGRPVLFRSRTTKNVRHA